jgi:ELWxxDGT repeat protein
MVLNDTLFFSAANALNGRELWALPLSDSITVSVSSDREGAEETSNNASLPNLLQLHLNYPNPFNPETMISFRLRDAGHVVVKVYNTLGQEIRVLMENSLSAGLHTVVWDGEDNLGRQAGSAVYIYTVTAVDASTNAGRAITEARKMILLK